MKLGDPLLAAHARSASRKLAFDIPGIEGDDQDDVIVQAERVDPAVFPVLNEALLGRKRITFTYRSMSGDSTSARAVASRSTRGRIASPSSRTGPIGRA